MPVEHGVTFGRTGPEVGGREDGQLRRDGGQAEDRDHPHLQAPAHDLLQGLLLAGDELELGLHGSAAGACDRIGDAHMVVTQQAWLRCGGDFPVLAGPGGAAAQKAQGSRTRGTAQDGAPAQQGR